MIVDKIDYTDFFGTLLKCQSCSKHLRRRVTVRRKSVFLDIGKVAWIDRVKTYVYTRGMGTKPLAQPWVANVFSARVDVVVTYRVFLEPALKVVVFQKRRGRPPWMQSIRSLQPLPDLGGHTICQLLKLMERHTRTNPGWRNPPSCPPPELIDQACACHPALRKLPELPFSFHRPRVRVMICILA